jgi:luciferase family oxidoreductase group 1
MIPLSVLDPSPVLAGVRQSRALWHTLGLARAADRLGYHRYWLAEHHSIPSVVSTAPEILIGHVADRTSRIRGGAGGIMLPNHSPLHIAARLRSYELLAETFGLNSYPQNTQTTQKRDKTATDYTG